MVRTAGCPNRYEKEFDMTKRSAILAGIGLAALPAAAFAMSALANCPICP